MTGPVPEWLLSVLAAATVFAGIGFLVSGGAHALSNDRAFENYLGFLVHGPSVLARNLSGSNQYGVQIEGAGRAPDWRLPRRVAGSDSNPEGPTPEHRRMLTDPAPAPRLRGQAAPRASAAGRRGSRPRT